MKGNIIAVVTGYHFGWKKQSNRKNAYFPYINTLKPYQFKVTIRTRELQNLKKYKSALVHTKKGNRKLVITKVDGVKDVDKAKKLQEVLKINSYGIKDNWLRHILEKKLNLKRDSLKEVMK